MIHNSNFCYGNSAERINNTNSLVLPGTIVCFNDSIAVKNSKVINGTDTWYVGKVNPGVKQRLRWNKKIFEAYPPHYGWVQ